MITIDYERGRGDRLNRFIMRMDLGRYDINLKVPYDSNFFWATFFIFYDLNSQQGPVQPPHDKDWAKPSSLRSIRSMFRVLWSGSGFSAM